MDWYEDEETTFDAGNNWRKYTKKKKPNVVRNVNNVDPKVYSEFEKEYEAFLKSLKQQIDKK